MTTTLEPTRREAEEVESLEALWRRPSAEARRQPPRRSLARHLNAVLVAGWAVVLAGVLLFAPASNPEAATPLWTDLALGVWFAALVAAGGFAFMGLGRAALVGSAVAAGCGVALGISCRATEHHSGSWWLVETAAFAGLLALSLGALASRRARR
jgi:hypothetical protein